MLCRLLYFPRAAQKLMKFSFACHLEQKCYAYRETDCNNHENEAKKYVKYEQMLQKLFLASTRIFASLSFVCDSSVTFIFFAHLLSSPPPSSLPRSLYQPKSTRRNLLSGTSSLLSSESELLVWKVDVLFPEHPGEQRYCNNGSRYMPQKSTNLICSTWASK